MPSMPSTENVEKSFACSVCLFVEPRAGLDEDAAAETEVLTVINGQMVCVRHMSCVGTNHHFTIVSAVRLESEGQFSSLTEYQNWRAKQL